MRAIWLLLFPLLVAATLSTCQGPANNAATSVRDLAPAARLLQYDSLRSKIEAKQQEFKAVYIDAEDVSARAEKREEAKAFLLKTLTDEVFEHWYETSWDYYGTTETPGEGSIACGYFISTTLKHCGFDLERFKLAQQPASNIIKTLCDPSTLKRIGHNNLNALVQHMRESPKGLYIIGLDNHVGFVLHDEEGIWMIHSTPSVSPGGVIKEPFATSKIINKSQNFYVANMLDHEKLLDQWILKQNIPTVTN